MGRVYIFIISLAYCSIFLRLASHASPRTIVRASLPWEACLPVWKSLQYTACSTMQHCAVQCAVPCNTVLCSVLYHATMCCAVCSRMQHYAMLCAVPCITMLCCVQYHATLCYAVCSTMQHYAMLCAVPCNTVLCCVQYHVTLCYAVCSTM